MLTAALLNEPLNRFIFGVRVVQSMHGTASILIQYTLGHAYNSSFVIIYIFYSPKTAANTKAKRNKKSRACANSNHSWFQVISTVISSNNRVII